MIVYTGTSSSNVVVIIYLISCNIILLSSSPHSIQYCVILSIISTPHDKINQQTLKDDSCSCPPPLPRLLPQIARAPTCRFYSFTTGKPRPSSPIILLLLPFIFYCFFFLISIPLYTSSHIHHNGS